MIMGQYFSFRSEQWDHIPYRYGDESTATYVIWYQRMQTGKLFIRLSGSDELSGMDSVCTREMTPVVAKENEGTGHSMEHQRCSAREARVLSGRAFWKIAGEVGNKAILGLMPIAVWYIFRMWILPYVYGTRESII